MRSCDTKRVKVGRSVVLPLRARCRVIYTGHLRMSLPSNLFMRGWSLLVAQDFNIRYRSHTYKTTDKNSMLWTRMCENEVCTMFLTLMVFQPSMFQQFYLFINSLFNFIWWIVLDHQFLRKVFSFLFVKMTVGSVRHAGNKQIYAVDHSSEH